MWSSATGSTSASSSSGIATETVSCGLASSSSRLADGVAEADRLGAELDRGDVEAGEVEQLIAEAAHACRLVAQGPVQRGALLVVDAVAALVEGDADPVDGRERVSELVRGERDELALERVEPLHLLAQRRHDHPDRLQRRQLALVELERFAAAVAGEEAEAVAGAEERQREHGGDAVGLGQLRRQRPALPHVVDEDRIAARVGAGE